MKLVANDGSPVDADFHAALTSDGFDVVIESRGGPSKNRPPRNPDYNKLLRLILKRVSVLGTPIQTAVVESRRTKELTTAERTINSEQINYPILVDRGTDFDFLCRELTRPQGAIGRTPGAKGPGNRSKRIRISFSWNGFAVRIEDLEQLLVEGEYDLLNPLGGTRDDLEGVDVLEEWHRQVALYEGASPTTRDRLSKSIERGSVGKLVKTIAKYRCQICDCVGIKSQTFQTANGNDYVEAHHVVPVSSGRKGVLSPSNVISVCAAHHRELHYGADASVTDLGDSFRIVVEAGRAEIPKKLLR